MDSVIWFTQTREFCVKILIAILVFARKLVNQMTGLVSPKIKANTHTHYHLSHQTLPQHLLCTIYSAEYEEQAKP